MTKLPSGADLRALFWLIGGDASARMLAQLATIFIARILQPSGFGTFSAALAVLSLLLVLADGGVGDAAVRQLTGSGDAPKRYQDEAQVVRFWLSVPWALIGLVLIAIPSNNLVRAIAWALVALPGLLAAFGNGQAARAGLRFRVASAWSSVLLVSQYFGGLLGAWTRGTAVGAMQGVLLALFATTARTQLRSTRTSPLHVRWHLWLTAGRPFWITASSVALYSRGDRVLLAFIAGTTVAGPYAAAYSLVMLSSILGTSLHAILLPKQIQDFETGAPDRWLPLAMRLFVALLPIAAATALLGPIVVRMLFGTQFERAGALIQVLSPLAIFYVLNPVLASSLIAGDRQKTLARVAVMNLAEAAIGYPIAIVLWGDMGAATVSVAIEALGCIQTFNAVRALARERIVAHS